MILASASPRRRELMKKITTDFSCVVSSIDENITGDPYDVCRILAENKALDIAKDFKGEIVIGADTVVAIDGVILGKPRDKKENMEFLKRLSGREHYVHTGYAVVLGDKILSETLTTTVLFKKLDDIKITEYVNSGLGLDKAGGYGIQDRDFVKEILGDYENVVGFSTSKVKSLLDALKEKV